MSLARSNENQLWNNAIQDFLFSPFSRRLSQEFPTFQFVDNIDFIKIKLLHHLRLLYFVDDKISAKKIILTELLKIMFLHEAIKPFKKDINFENYLSAIISDLIEQYDSIAESYLKKDLLLGIKTYGFQGIKSYESDITSLCEDDAARLKLSYYRMDKNKLAHIMEWVKKNNDIKKKPRKATLNDYMSYIFYASWFGCIAGLQLIAFDYMWLGISIIIPTSLLAVVYGREFSNANIQLAQNVNKSLTKIAGDLISIKLKIINKTQLKLTLENNFVSAFVDTTVPADKTAVSGHVYRRLLKSTNVVVTQAPIMRPIVTEAPKLGLIDQTHVRFFYNNRIYDAHLVESALPDDKRESEAVLKGFQKGLSLSTKDKSPHAIVVADKRRDGCFFKIRTPYDPRMKCCTLQEIDKSNVEIHFDFYDRNAHRPKRARGSKFN
jgi:hypothetical protein